MFGRLRVSVCVSVRVFACCCGCVCNRVCSMSVRVLSFCFVVLQARVFVFVCVFGDDVAYLFVWLIMCLRLGFYSLCVVAAWFAFVSVCVFVCGRVCVCVRA